MMSMATVLMSREVPRLGQVVLAMVTLALTTAVGVAIFVRRSRSAESGTRGMPAALMLRGFATAVLAALFWGVGNVLTKYSAHHYDVATSAGPIVDIALANYLSGALTVSLLAWLLHRYHGTGASR